MAACSQKSRLGDCMGLRIEAAQFEDRGVFANRCQHCSRALDPHGNAKALICSAGSTVESSESEASEPSAALGASTAAGVRGRLSNSRRMSSAGDNPASPGAQSASVSVELDPSEELSALSLSGGSLPGWAASRAPRHAAPDASNKPFGRRDNVAATRICSNRKRRGRQSNQCNSSNVTTSKLICQDTCARELESPTKTNT